MRTRLRCGTPPRRPQVRQSRHHLQPPRGL